MAGLLMPSLQSSTTEYLTLKVFIGIAGALNL